MKNKEVSVGLHLIKVTLFLDIQQVEPLLEVLFSLVIFLCKAPLKSVLEVGVQTSQKEIEK